MNANAPRSAHRACQPWSMTFNRNVAECVSADGGCGQRWLLGPRGWDPINNSLASLIGASL